LTGMQLVVTTLFGSVAAAVALGLGNGGAVTAFMMLSLPLTAYRTPAMVILTRRLAFTTKVRVELTETLTYLIWAVTAAFLGYGAWALATATVGKTLIGTVVACRLSPAGFPVPSLRFGRLK